MLSHASSPCYIFLMAVSFTNVSLPFLSLPTELYMKSASSAASVATFTHLGLEWSPSSFHSPDMSLSVRGVSFRGHTGRPPYILTGRLRAFLSSGVIAKCALISPAPSGDCSPAELTYVWFVSKSHVVVGFPLRFSPKFSCLDGSFLLPHGYLFKGRL